MKIANAIYDIVFKYLMEDERVAKLLLSALLKMEVLSLEFQPQEYITDLKSGILTVFRLDFKAKVKLNNGEQKVVLIELQKAKYPSDILRFRRYLGEQYASEKNVLEKTKDGKKYREAIPIITIYFLGYPLEKYKDKTIIRVKRHYFDDISGDELTEGKDPFIEALTHDSIIVQVGAIRNKKRRTKLEKILSIFEPGIKHQIEINENDYPEEYQPVIRRLVMAYADEKVRKIMKIEDEILQDLTNAERRAEKAEEIAREAKKREEEAKKREEEAKKREEEAKQREKEAKKKLALKMKQYGEAIEDIIKEIGLSKDDIEKL